MNFLRKILKEEEGADLAEYALLLGIITIAVASAITAFGTKISGSITNATNIIQ